MATDIRNAPKRTNIKIKRGLPIPVDCNKEMLSNHAGINSFDTLVEHIPIVEARKQIKKLGKVTLQKMMDHKKQKIKLDKEHATFDHVNAEGEKYSFKMRRYPQEMLKDVMNLPVRAVVKKWHTSTKNVCNIRKWLKEGRLTIKE